MASKQIFAGLLIAAFLAVPRTATALDEVGEGGGGGGGEGKGFGLGMETVLTAPFAPGTTFSNGGAATLGYDMGNFRIDGLLYLLFVNGNGGADSTAFAIGARAFYKLHSTSKADFSVGGGLALGFLDVGAGSGNFRIALDGAFQIRVWLANNVALNASAGIGFAVGDNPFVFALGGQLTGGFGMIYYFE